MSPVAEEYKQKENPNTPSPPSPSRTFSLSLSTLATRHPPPPPPRAPVSGPHLWHSAPTPVVLPPFASRAPSLHRPLLRGRQSAACGAGEADAAGQVWPRWGWIRRRAGQIQWWRSGPAPRPPLPWCGRGGRWHGLLPHRGWLDASFGEQRRRRRGQTRRWRLDEVGGPVMGSTGFLFFYLINRGRQQTASVNRLFIVTIGLRRLALPAFENVF